MIPSRSSKPQGGYSIVEFLIATALSAILMTAVLTLFNQSGAFGKEQIRISDMQNAARASQEDLVRQLRMSGRGGIPRGDLPFGTAISLRNNAPATGDESRIAIGDTATPRVAEGSDVLTVRGVFSTSVYQIGSVTSSFVLDDPSNPTSGTIQIYSPNPDTGVTQDLSALEDAVAAGFGEALVLVSPASDFVYALVELNPAASSVKARDADGEPTHITLGFDIGTPGGTNTADLYVELSADGDYPIGLQTVSFVGIVEEYRYFIRHRNSIENDDSSDPIFTLSRGRFYPGTETPHGADTNLQTDLADNVLDLQVALGIDRNGDGTIDESATSPQSDEWLYNDAGDNPADSGWNDNAGDVPDLYYVRVNTLARTDRPDTKYVAPAIQSIEDNAYDEPELPADAEERSERYYRRRQTQDVVDLRNL